ALQRHADGAIRVHPSRPWLLRVPPLRPSLTGLPEPQHRLLQRHNSIQPRRTDPDNREENPVHRLILLMKKAGVLVVGVVALAYASAGVAAARGSTARHPAHPRAGKVVAKVPIPAGTGAFAVGEGAVWSVSDTGPVLTRIDPDRNAVVASIKLNKYSRLLHEKDEAVHGVLLS